MITQMYGCFFPQDLVTSYNSFKTCVLHKSCILGIQLACICCYVGQTSNRLSGCQEQSLSRRYMYMYMYEYHLNICEYVNRPYALTSQRVTSP